jgi:hypothetical protein
VSPAKRAPVRAPQESSYATSEPTSTLERNKRYKLVLAAVLYLESYGWHPDVVDLRTYGPSLRRISIADLEKILEDLVRTEDLVQTLETPQNCRRPRPCYRTSQTKQTTERTTKWTVQREAKLVRSRSNLPTSLDGEEV